MNRINSLWSALFNPLRVPSIVAALPRARRVRVSRNGSGRRTGVAAARRAARKGRLCARGRA